MATTSKKKKNRLDNEEYEDGMKPVEEPEGLIEGWGIPKTTSSEEPTFSGLEILEPSKTEYLSKVHLQALESYDKDLKYARLAMAMEEQVLQNLELNLRLLSLNIETQRGRLQLKASEYNEEVRKFEEFKKTVWPQYGFSEEAGLGYNPISGKISR